MAKNFLYNLINSRSAALNISQCELVSMAGYANTAKGIRRLNMIEGFDFESSRYLIAQLPKILQVEMTEVEQAVRASLEALKAERELEWHQNFRPYARVRTGEGGRPRQITMAAICNAMRYVQFYFPEGTSSDDFTQLAVAAYKQNEKDVRRFFYEPEDIVVNFSTDRVACYSLEGDFLEELASAIEPASLFVTLR